MYDKLLMLYSEGAKIVPPGAEDILEKLYGALNALDTTASAVLIFDGVLVTAASFAAERGGVARVVRVSAIIVIIVALVSAGLCLRVAHISWPFLEMVVVTSGTPPGLDFSREFQALDAELALRTVLFQFAWILSVLAVVISILMVLYAVLFSPRHTGVNE